MRDIGAVWLDDRRCRFRVWAPREDKLHLHVIAPNDTLVEMVSRERGYHQVTLKDIAAGTRYRYRLAEGREFADPASGYQPEGVHGPSEVVPRHFDWSDDLWRGIPI